MNKRCLLRASEVLESIPSKEGHFRMESWGADLECGFTGCAVGWLAHLGTFPGLKLCSLPPGRYFLEYKSLRGFRAVGALFGVSSSEAKLLFDSYSYPAKVTPKQVAKTLREFVEDREGMREKLERRQKRNLKARGW